MGIAVGETPGKEEKMTRHLTEMQRYVTQQNGTEPPFNNEYWNNDAEGIYVDVVSGAALFSSADKFDSGTGWPSFTKPMDKKSVTERKETLFGLGRIEARSAKADSHLGHVFNDGPVDRGGMRYCVNSASLRFVPKQRLEEEGYAEYSSLFK